MRTVGLEIELPYVSRYSTNIINWCSFEVHDDGSIRDYNFTIDGVPIIPTRTQHRVPPSGAMSADRCGTEIVTSPYPMEEMIEIGKRFAEVYGHIPSTPRASIHVHVGVHDCSWRYVQRLVRWFVALEAPLYRLSALRTKHRGCMYFNGEYHDHKYARPLTNPVGLSNGRGSRKPLINVPMLLHADTASEFVAAWGRMDLTWRDLAHYCPHRLHGLNLVPLQTHGTVEWRLFNGVYRYIPDVLRIIDAVHTLAEVCDPPSTLPKMPLGSTPEFTADDMSDLLGFSVRHLWGNEWVEGCQNSFPMSHYRNGDFSAPPFTMYSVAQITNNWRQIDNGTDEFSFFVSSPSLDVESHASSYDHIDDDYDSDDDE